MKFCLLCLGLLAILTSGCGGWLGASTNDYNYMRHGAPVVHQYTGSNALGSHSSVTVDGTVDCERCRKDFPVSPGQPMHPVCLQLCYGVGSASGPYGYSGGTNPGQAAVQRASGGYISGMGPIMAGGTMPVSGSSASALHVVGQQVAQTAQDVCAIKKDVAVVQKKVGVPQTIDPKCQPKAKDGN